MNIHGSTAFEMIAAGVAGFLILWGWMFGLAAIIWACRSGKASDD